MHTDGSFDWFTEAPQIVDPIGVWGIIGATLVLVIGTVVVGSASLLLSRHVGAAVLLMMVGGLMAYSTELRFLRAIHPDDRRGHWLVVALIVLLALGSFLLLARLDYLAAFVTAAGHLAIIAAAWKVDALETWMSSVPIAFATIFVLFAVGLACATKR